MIYIDMQQYLTVSYRVTTSYCLLHMYLSVWKRYGSLESQVNSYKRLELCVCQELRRLVRLKESEQFKYTQGHTHKTRRRNN